MKSLLITVAATVLLCPAAHAGSPFNDMTEAQKRKIVVPDIKQLTYCVARQTLSDPDATDYYRQGNLGSYVGRQLQKCPREMNALLELYDSTYGEGEAENFIKGPYLSDLPRAVLSVIKPQLQAKVAEQLQNEQNVRDAEAAQEAEAKRKTEEDRLATLRLQADQAAEETKIAQEKQNKIDIATRTMELLRDKFYTCADQQLPGLVKSGESAEVLANTVMTICNKPLDDATGAAAALFRIRGDSTVQNYSDQSVEAGIKPLFKERLVADAVQAKAGVGSFATTQ